MTAQHSDRFSTVDALITEWIGTDRLTSEHIDKVLTKAMLADDETLNDAITHIKRSRPDLRNTVNAAFRDICGCLLDSECTELRNRANSTWFHMNNGPFKRSLLVRTDGDLTGIELKHTSRDRWVVFHADASEAGRVRVTYFDARGFQGHATRDTYAELLDEVVSDGFTHEVTGVLNELGVTETFIKGNEVATLIQKLNAGAIDWDTFTAENERINAQ